MEGGTAWQIFEGTWRCHVYVLFHQKSRRSSTSFSVHGLDKGSGRGSGRGKETRVQALNFNPPQSAEMNATHDWQTIGCAFRALSKVCLWSRMNTKFFKSYQQRSSAETSSSSNSFLERPLPEYYQTIITRGFPRPRPDMQTRGRILMMV